MSLNRFLERLVAWVIVILFAVMGLSMAMDIPVQDPTNWPYVLGGGLIGGTIVGYFIVVIATSITDKL